MPGHRPWSSIPRKRRDTGPAPKISIAPQIHVERLAPYVARVLEVIGHPEALVTDLSTLTDFLPPGNEALTRAICMARWRLELNLQAMVESSYIWEVAEALLEQDGA